MPLVLNNIDLEKELDDVQTRIIDSGTNGIEISDIIEIRNIDENASTSKESTSTTHGKFSDVLLSLFRTQFLVSTTVFTNFF